jgi:hypothetical protein
LKRVVAKISNGCKRVIFKVKTIYPITGNNSSLVVYAFKLNCLIEKQKSIKRHMKSNGYGSKPFLNMPLAKLDIPQTKWPQQLQLG